MSRDNQRVPQSWFGGDFDMLPIRSHLDSGPVPSSPTREEVSFALQVASSELESHEDEPLTIERAALVWRAEAMRARMLDAQASLTSADVMRAVAQILRHGTYREAGRAARRGTKPTSLPECMHRAAKALNEP